ncbi:MAG TPA: type II toxin-antitoxin system prevent-host-death family antitoxin [Terriglobia bacterium]|nr:type II toxin-antitoxin system prevent-host-death family antitoxin [Terriglobia bacterium]
MKTATVRDLRYHFSEVEARLRQGEEIVIRKRNRPIAKLVPLPPQPEAGDYPDFAARQKKIFGNKVLPVSGAEIVAWDRGER